MEKSLKTKEIIHLSKSEPVSMADEWFEIATKDHFWMIWRFKVLEHWLKTMKLLKTGETYLEVGCGHGQFLLQSDRDLGIIVDGCDLNLFALEKIVNAKGKVFVYDIGEKNPNMINHYNGIFLLDVIEHIEDDKAFLSTALAHSKKGGIVVVNVPALHFLFSKYDIVAGHKRRYSKQELYTLFERCGIEPIHIGYWGFSLLGVAFLRKIYLHFVPNNKVIRTGFKPPAAWLNYIFTTLMKLELIISKSPLVGTSVFAIGRKL